MNSVSIPRRPSCCARAASAAGSREAIAPDPSERLPLGAVAQQHLDRLSPVDAEFLAHVRSRLHLVPRYRQRLAFPPLETGFPLWIDDPTFNLEYHVTHTAVP